jgi:DNA-binding NtrC family response regulator
MLVANTASETWRILERGIPIDRVLIDLTSPHDGRIAIAEEIQARYPGIKIVISTDTPDAVGAFPVLQKPYAPLELWAALAETVT